MNEFKISNEDQNYNTLIGEDKSGIDKFLEKLKKSTFEVLSILLKDEEEEGVFMFCIQTTFDYIQMLEFIFNEKINHVKTFLLDRSGRPIACCSRSSQSFHFSKLVPISEIHSTGLST